MSALHIADTGFFVALGKPSRERYQRVRTFAKRNEIVFVVPKRIYGESLLCRLAEQHATKEYAGVRNSRYVTNVG